MTMRITIKNEDQTHSAIVTTIDKGLESPFETDTTLAPGEQKEFYIYEGRFVRIKEVPK